MMHIYTSVCYAIKSSAWTLSNTESVCVPSHSLDHPRSVPQEWNGLVHQWVGLHKVQYFIRQHVGRAISGSLHCTPSWSADRERDRTVRVEEWTDRKRMERAIGVQKEQEEKSQWSSFSGCWSLYENICWIGKLLCDWHLELIAGEEVDYICRQMLSKAALQYLDQERLTYTLHNNTSVSAPHRPARESK